MAARKTGQKAAISLVTSGLSIVTTSITPAPYSLGSIDTPNLALDRGDCMPSVPEDLAQPGMIEVEFESDEAIDPDGLIGVEQNVIITYPVPAGLTNGATDTHAGAYVASFTPGPLGTNNRRLSTMSIKVVDYPTKAAAS